MQIVNLYKYIREDGGTSISPNKPSGEYTEMFRLIADEGKAITNGDTVTSCIDVKSTDVWVEIDDGVNEATEPAAKLHLKKRATKQ